MAISQSNLLKRLPSAKSATDTMQTNGFEPGNLAVLQQNLTLAGLSQAALERLTPYLVPLDLPQGYLLSKPEQAIQWIYFLDRGMCSMTIADMPGTAVEVGIIGREGLVGVHALLGTAKSHNRMVMQGAGSGRRIRVEHLQRAMAEDHELLLPMHRFVYVLLEQTTQLILCNRLHDLDARLARWLLMTSDFMESSSLALTQEYLAEMLGVGRPAVTIAAGNFQRQGLIAYSRGLIEMVNREQLTTYACECYGVIRATYHTAYPGLY